MLAAVGMLFLVMAGRQWRKRPERLAKSLRRQTDDVRGSLVMRSRRLVEAPCPVEPVLGLFQAIRPRLCTTLPLATTSTPRRKGREAIAPSSRCWSNDLVASMALHDRDVGVREHVHEHRPGPVVDPPAGGVDGDPDRIQELRHLDRELRVAGCRVLHPEQLVREAGEVVDRPGFRHGGDGDGIEVPVSRDGQDGTGRPTEVPKARQASVQRLWWRAFMGFPWPRKAAGMVVISLSFRGRSRPTVRTDHDRKVPMPDAGRAPDDRYGAGDVTTDRRVAKSSLGVRHEEGTGRRLLRGRRHGHRLGADPGAEPGRGRQRTGRRVGTPNSSHESILQQALDTLVGKGTITKTQADAVKNQVHTLEKQRAKGLRPFDASRPSAVRSAWATTRSGSSPRS